MRLALLRLRIYKRRTRPKVVSIGSGRNRSDILTTRGSSLRSCTAPSSVLKVAVTEKLPGSGKPTFNFSSRAKEVGNLPRLSCSVEVDRVSSSETSALSGSANSSVLEPIIGDDTSVGDWLSVEPGEGISMAEDLRVAKRPAVLEARTEVGLGGAAEFEVLRGAWKSGMVPYSTSTPLLDFSCVEVCLMHHQYIW